MREVYQRIVRDKGILRANTYHITNRIQQIAVKELKAKTKNLNGEEKIERMLELANEVYDGISEAIEEVDKDLAYNPKKFLGFVLFPESIISIVSFLATLGFALFSQSMGSGS